MLGFLTNAHSRKFTKIKRCGIRMAAKTKELEMKNRDCAYPAWKNSTPVAVDGNTIRAAERQIDSCEGCTPETAEIPFDYVLDCVTGCDPEITDYVLTEPAACPRCAAPVKTGYLRWSTSEDGKRVAFILPGTLVTLKKG